MSNKRWIVVIGVLLLGAAGRSLHIAEQSFWVDEGYAFYHAHFPDLMTSLARDTHPPLYFAALRLWSEIAGHSELALRWFSVLPSMLSLAMIYQLARAVMWQRDSTTNGLVENVPVFAMLMLALADAENYLAQEARHYTWLVFLVLCSMTFFLRFMWKPKRRDYVLWIFSTVLMVYTHYIAAFAGIAQGLFALLFLRGKTRRRALAGLVFSALTLLPWLLTVGWQQLDNGGANWSVRLSAAVARDILVKYFSEQWAFVIGLLLLGCVIVVYRRGQMVRLRWRKVSWLLLFWLIVPFALTVLVNEYLPFLQPRRLTLWTPAIALLVALGLGNIRPPVRALLIGVLLIYGVTQVDFYRVKPNWREIAQMTARYAVPGDLVLTDVAGGDYQLAYYLTRKMPKGILPPTDVRYESLKVRRDFHGESYESWLPQLLENYQSVWLMHWSNDNSAFAWLDKIGFSQTADFVHQHDGGDAGLVNMRVYRYDRIAEQAPVALFVNGMILQEYAFDLGDLRLDMIWRGEAEISQDYVISAKLIGANGAVAAQHDSQPQLNQRPVSGWRTGELIYSPHELQRMQSALAGDYQVIVQVYRLEDGKPANVLTEDGAEYASLATIRLEEPIPAE